ncbi:LPS-assembly protein LptD [Verticiella sediminum]|uniref:LPS-assembly protein LptD n=1 Tax=Verticiella sediminum TaxID=1247510 RepID=A0A556B294_9BURK|nr:LPS-assembly protein LptD [Verticiella sediminum]
MPGARAAEANEAGPPRAGLRVSPGLREHRELDANSLPAFTRSEELAGNPDESVTLTGAAEVRRNDVILKGSRIHYDRVGEVLDAEGDVRLLREGSVVTGPGLRLELDTDTGAFSEPNFYVAATGGSGRAREAEFLSRSRTRLYDAYYTGCPCPEPDWWVRARQVDLDFDKNEGLAYGGVVYFKGVPILGSPILSFPITKDRKSGFLPPTFGITSRSGVQVTTPYYLNLAPNYDATLYPSLYARRGLQLGGEFRYLRPTFSGEVYGTWLPNDRERGDGRWYYNLQHRQTLGGGFGLSWDVQRASDDDYFRDFSQVALDQASTVTLPRSATLSWANTYFNAQLTPVRYQTLQDADAPIVPPYDMMPRFTFAGQRYNWGGADLLMHGDITRFERSPWLTAMYDLPDDKGTRFSIYPSLSYPVVRPGWFFTPKVGVHASYYDTRFNQSLYYGSGANDPTQFDVASQSRVLPIASLDTGLVFERQARLFNRDMTQTLEPRLYYLYVPYKDQSMLPVYDTALADFSFSQIFSENAFSGGWDRINNAHQLTAALSSRWIDASSGLERARVSAAQRLYFTDQRVTLPGETARENSRSDFLFEVYGAFTESLSAQATVQYNPHESQFEQASVSGRWDAARLATVYTAYRYRRPSYLQNGQEQASVAFQWPLTQRWNAVTRLDYSLLDSRFSQVLGGLEYNGGCCWTARVVGQRYAVSSEATNTAVFFQLELNGLGALGTNPMETLRRNIPGYESVTPPVVPGSTFERYE